MLTEKEKAGLAAMSREDQVKLLALIREAKALFGQGLGCMPQSAIDDMVKIVPDGLMRDIVKDLRKLAEPSGLATEDRRPVVRTRGWQTPAPLAGPVGVAICDQMMDVQDALDKRDLEQRMRGFVRRM
jgi:hypothetical protein